MVGIHEWKNFLWYIKQYKCELVYSWYTKVIKIFLTSKLMVYKAQYKIFGIWVVFKQKSCTKLYTNVFLLWSNDMQIRAGLCNLGFYRNQVVLVTRVCLRFWMINIEWQIINQFHSFFFIGFLILVGVIKWANFTATQFSLQSHLFQIIQNTRFFMLNNISLHRNSILYPQKYNKIIKDKEPLLQSKVSQACLEIPTCQNLTWVSLK